MSIRVGVDVGGTFTKAVAFDLSAGEVCAQAVVPTTHQHEDGVAAGVVEVIAAIADEVGAGRIDLVTHSTTQAVNALLEGDVATVGVVGLGRRPDLRKARKRTVDTRITVGADRRLPTRTEFLDVTDGLDDAVAVQVVQRLVDAGARAIAVAEAFAPDDSANEQVIAAAARAAGLPVTSSAEMSGLYGLELRAVTAALNASIMPIALRTAEVVGEGVAAAGVSSAVMVMRGDAGATDLAGFRHSPARTLYSGPAASVAGVLRSADVSDGVIVEVGGTSTNIAAIHRGRPALSYVKVASHSTAIRSLDVEVLGVAGGSMLRAGRRGVHGVGPRSAHIAGLPYACFRPSSDFDGATARLMAPREGDPADYLVIDTAAGESVALTITCAANALGYVEPGDHAQGSREAALAAFGVAGALLRAPAEKLAAQMLEAAVQAIGDVVTAMAGEHKLVRPAIIAVGGGAGGLGRVLASAMSLDLVIPDHAAVISAIGDALSLVRTSREQAFGHPTPADVQQLIADAEREAVDAGASAASLEVRVEHLPERGAVRVTCTGSVGLVSGAMPGRALADEDEVAASPAMRGIGVRPQPIGQFWLADVAAAGRVVLIDRYADVVVDARGEVLLGPVDAASVEAGLGRHTKRASLGSALPDVWVVSGSRVVQVAEPDAENVLETIGACESDQVAVVIGRE